jgi:hypothetical protein
MLWIARSAGGDFAFGGEFAIGSDFANKACACLDRVFRSGGFPDLPPAG